MPQPVYGGERVCVCPVWARTGARSGDLALFLFDSYVHLMYTLYYPCMCFGNILGFASS